VPEIHSQTDDATVPVAEGDTILQATLGAGIDHTHVCGGNARCSTCRVYILDGLEHCLPRNEQEQRIADKLGFPDHIRLACQTRVKGDVTIKRVAIDDLDIEIILKQIGDESGTQFGKEVELAILFFDIENYTQFVDAYPAYDVVHVLHRYYQTMNEIIERHDGVISDVAGDGILALFGVLAPRRNPVWDAVRAVHDMRTALIRFNDYLEKMYGCALVFRAGIHFGKAIIGNFDTGLMSKISAIGDSVNLASRIEDANKAFGTRLLVSEAALEQIQDKVTPKAVHHTGLKGKPGQFALYEIEP
jgi:adenylate cyclase